MGFSFLHCSVIGNFCFSISIIVIGKLSSVKSKHGKKKYPQKKFGFDLDRKNFARIAIKGMKAIQDYNGNHGK